MPGIGSGYLISGASSLRSERNAAQASLKTAQAKFDHGQQSAGHRQLTAQGDPDPERRLQAFGTAEKNVANTSQAFMQAVADWAATEPGSAAESAADARAGQLYDQLEQQIGAASALEAPCVG